MAQRVWVFLAFVLVVAAVGCKGTMNVVGKYKAQIEMSEEDKKNPMAAMAQGMAESMTLELKDDRTFAMTMMLPIEGTYTVEGSTLTLTPTKMMGMSLSEMQKQNPGAESEPLRFNVTDGGKTLTAIPDKKQQDPGTLKFVRV